MSGASPPKPEAQAGPYEDLVNRLVASYEAGPRSMHHLGGYELPQMHEVAKCLEETRELLFPGFVGPQLAGATAAELRAHVGERLETLGRRLQRQVYRGL